VPGDLGGFGGVLGEVARDHAIGDVTGAGQGDVPHVEALVGVTPADRPAARTVGVFWTGESGLANGGGDRLVQVGGGEPGRWWHGGFRVERVDAVEADQGVEVHGAACLVLGGFAVAKPDRRDMPRLTGLAVDDVERDATLSAQGG